MQQQGYYYCLRDKRVHLVVVHLWLPSKPMEDDFTRQEQRRDRYEGEEVKDWEGDRKYQSKEDSVKLYSIIKLPIELLVQDSFLGLLLSSGKERPNLSSFLQYPFLDHIKPRANVQG